jgi:hypothetical protein
MGIIGLLGRRVRALPVARNSVVKLHPRDHSARRARPRLWDEGYISLGTVVRYFRFSDAEVRDQFESVIEAIGDIGHADGHGQFHDLAVVVILAQFLESGCADAGGAAR